MKQKIYLMLAGLFLLTVQLKAQAPQSINYQGVARSSTGAVLPNQAISLRLTIHQGSNNGSSVYQETWSVTTNSFGLFNVALGGGTVVSGNFSTINWGANNEFLEVEMDPAGGSNYSTVGTSQFLSVPYALSSASSGKPWATSGNSIYNTNTGSVGIGTANPPANTTFEVLSGHLWAGYFSTDTIGGYGVEGVANTTDGYGYGGYFSGGYVGSDAYVYGATDGYDYYGSYNEAYSTASSYMYGTYSDAESTNGANYGVVGSAYDYGSGNSYGVYGSGSSSTGIGYGLYGIGSPVGGYGAASGTGIVFSEMGSVYGGIANVVGLQGEVTSSSGSNSTTWNDGVLGIATNPDAEICNGVAGFGTGGAIWNVGLLGLSQSTGSDDYSIGVYGQDNANDLSTTATVLNDAGYFYGDVDIIGSISKSSGTFKIDDPLDPANKYLYHSFVESPDMMNVYNGNVVTDAQGNATVTLPQYFQAENKDFKYQLTVIGQFAQAIIGTKVNNNQFTIKTDKPNVEVSWQVTGVRNDPYANEHRVVAEVEKKGSEKGRYLFPQYYGQPVTMSIGYLIAQTKNRTTLTSARVAPRSAVKPVPPTKTGNAGIAGNIK